MGVPLASVPVDHPPGAPAPAAPLVAVERGGVVESLHLGHLVVTDADGRVLASVGDPRAPVLARSALKPLQVVGMLRSGLRVADDPDGAEDPGGGAAAGGAARALALAAASHNGEPVHVDGVRAALAAAGCTEADLRNTPDVPLHAPSAAAWLAGGHPPSSVTANCSGKHAAMLATCAARGWSRHDYLERDHPLQPAVLEAIDEQVGGLLPGPGAPRSTGRGADRRSGGPWATTDGCGTPLPLVGLLGLARAYSALATAAPGSAEGRVAASMRAHPHLVAGTDRQVTAFMAGVPGLVAKDGAEGVFALALADGRAAALKVLDGSVRPFPALVAAVLAALGVDAEVVRSRASAPVLGHGRDVGSVTAVADLGHLG